MKDYRIHSLQEKPPPYMADAVAIVNLRAAAGRTAAVFKSVLPHLPSGIDVSFTQWSGHAVELACNAVRTGKRTIVAVGGDGTINKVVNGLFDADGAIAADARLVIIPSGTGSDFQRSLGIPTSPRRAARLLQTGTPRLIDVMRVRYMTLEGVPAMRYSVNVTSFGLGGAVAHRANSMSKALGGKTSFLLATAIAAARFFGNMVAIRMDGKQVFSGKITNVAAGNGQYHGGGMWICPGAELDDGLINVTTIDYLTLFQLLRELPRLYNGKIRSYRKVRSFQARVVEATADETARIEIDGEPLGMLPIQISILPKALLVFAP